MTAAREAWERADGALDMACSALAAVPGVGDEYFELCRAVATMQREGRSIIKAADRTYAICMGELDEDASPGSSNTSGSEKGAV